ncbi:MAG: hemolysin [Salinivirgaceae bacterium]|nr:MAG: hemolysin [Salinivirgaceae bacterium]
MVLLIIYLFIAIGISFLCSILEAVLLSTPDSYVEVLKNEKRKGAATLDKLKSEIDKPLSAILTINTIAHTIGAAGVGAQASKVFGEVYFGIISAILTLLILILSEIIPKTIGATHWRKLILPSVPLLKSFLIIAFPFVILSEQITKLIAKKGKAFSFSRQDLSTIASIGYKEGIIDKDESQLIFNLMKLDKVQTEDIMTPRIVMVTASEKMTVGKLFNQKDELNFSRIPIYNKNKEDITGYVLKADVWEKVAMDEHEVTLADLKREITKVYERVPVPRLFQLMVKKNDMMALVIDEYGGTEGLVTMEDIIETITGIEIVDEKDTHIDYQKLARELWKKRIEENRGNIIDL